jgi:leucyl/phenylalanyl-tRNA--protein transferase
LTPTGAKPISTLMKSLDPDLLLRAYSIGVFPMSDGRDADELYWVEPRRRAILPLDSFHLSRSLRKTLRSDVFEVTRDREFRSILRLCADREDTWINAEIEASYIRLHEAGRAHSIEVWQDGALAGGLYGVRLGAAFFGESMVSLKPDASKVALAWLVARLIVGGFRLLDCQFMTSHLESLGAIEIDQKDYLVLLDSALGGGAAGAGASGAGPVEFEALDRLLAGRAAAGAGVPPPGWTIAQLIGHTS